MVFGVHDVRELRMPCLNFLGTTSGERMQTGLKTDGGTLSTVSVGVGQSRLTDAKQIQQMVIRVLQRQLPALRTQHERACADSSLSGKWTLYFNVTPEGRGTTTGCGPKHKGRIA